MSFTCPRCGRTSANPNDEREGYCGNCHDWTRPTVGMIVERPLPAEGQAARITELWAWTTIDPLTDVEGIVAARIPGGKMALPLVVSTARLAEMMRPIAEAVARNAEEPRPTVRLRRFVPAEGDS